jgi:hypothetical protein
MELDYVKRLIESELYEVFDRDYVESRIDEKTGTVFFKILSDTDEAGEDIEIIYDRDYIIEDKEAIVVYYPQTQPYVTEPYDFNFKTIQDIDRYKEELKKKFDGEYIRLRRGIDLDIELVAGVTTPYYDDVGNRWERERIYLKLRFTKYRFNDSDIVEIVRAVINDVFRDTVESMIPLEALSVIGEIENIAYATYPKF